MSESSLPVFDIGQLTRAITTSYANFPLASVNDHVVKVSVMTQPYYWHYHPNSDETFLVLEGGLVIELDTETIDLLPGQLMTIPKNTVHRTRPKGERSVNLTFEREQIDTIAVER